MKCITLWIAWLVRCDWTTWLGCVVWTPANRQFSPATCRIQGIRQVAGGAAEEPCLATLGGELAAAHFQFEKLTLYRLKLFVVGVGTELL